MATLSGLLLALFLGAMDQTIVATAQPRIVASLHGLDRYAWVATAYMLAATSLMPIYGRLADIASRRRVEIFVVSLFLAGSFLCGLSGEFGPLPLLGDGMSQLIAFRGLQGLGAAGLYAMTFIIIADLFSPAERGRYQGYVGAVFGVASVVGPLVGGFLTDHAGGLVTGVEGWRWVFYVNMPFGALALLVIIRRMPPLWPPDRGARLDLLAAALLVAGLAPLTLALSLDKRAHPLQSPLSLGLVAFGALSLALFAIRTVRSDHPIINLALFKNRVFSVANGATFLLAGTFIGVVIFLPLFLTQVVGASATRAGMALTPLSLGVVLGSTVSGQLVARYGHYRRLLLVGGALLIGAMVLLWRMSVHTTYAHVLIYAAICGLGVGPSMPLYVLAVQNAVSPKMIGQATAAGQFFRRMGGTVATALLGTVLSTTLADALPHASPHGRSRALMPHRAATSHSPLARAAFAAATRRIFFVTLLMAAAGWITTFFLPELPLRGPDDEPAGPKPTPDKPSDDAP